MRITNTYNLDRIQDAFMAHLFNRKASKRVANLSVNSDLLKAARESGVNLSAVTEEALAYKAAEAKREQWKKENAEAIAAYNNFVEEQGVYFAGSRSF
jgi:antitoxin CcdA